MITNKRTYAQLRMTVIIGASLSDPHLVKTMILLSVYMYYINHAQFLHMGDKAQNRRASALSPIRTVFGHDLCNLCHHKIQLFLPVL